MPLRTQQALDLIFEAYQVQRTKDEWLASLLSVAASAFPGGARLGVEVDLESGELKSEVVPGHNAADPDKSYLSQSHQLAPMWVKRATYGSGRSWISLRRSVDARYFDSAEWLDELRQNGYRDMLAVVSKQSLPHVPACALFTLAEHPAHATRTEVELWERVAEHLGAAQVIRSQCCEAADALLRSDGGCVDARQEAVEHLGALRDLVRRRDRALSQWGRKDVTEALSFWDQLASGVWTLVDHFDTDGRHYVVARRNPRTDSLKQLTARELEVVEYAGQGKSNDWIAHELGLAPATISEHLRCAQRRLGVSSRMQLLSLKKIGCSS